MNDEHDNAEWDAAMIRREEANEERRYAVALLIECAEAMLLRTASLATPERENLQYAVTEAMRVHGIRSNLKEADEAIQAMNEANEERSEALRFLLEEAEHAIIALNGEGRPVTAGWLHDAVDEARRAFGLTKPTS